MSVQRFNPFGVNGVPYNTSANTYIGSTYFNGSTDFLSVPALSSLGSSNFTIEAWVYPNSTSAADNSIFFINGATSAYAAVRLGWQYNSGLGNLYLLTSLNGSAWVGSTSAISNSYFPINTWTHLAIVRNGNNLNVFQNGILIYTNSSISGSLYAGTLNYIGSYIQTSTYYYFPGYISNLRIVNGTALYTSNFIPPTTPLTVIANTALLTCQSTQTVTYDANTTPNPITVAGTPRPTKSVPFSQSWAGQFNGSTSYLTSGSSASPLSAFNFGTGDFTVESWVYLTTTGSKPLVDFRGASTVAPGIGFYTGNQPYLYYNGSIVYQPSSLSLTPNTWSHIALVRSSGVSKFYLNGIGAATTYTDTNNYPAAPIVIGTDTIAGGSNWWSGYISNLRVVKGTAVYTSNFTPSNTPLTAITNTVLLTCQNSSNSNTFIDNSTSALTITNNGTPGANVVSMAAPGYSPMPIIDTSTAATTYGGSYYLNGTSDYMVVPYTSAINLSTGAPNFTVEFWMYLTSLPSSCAYLLKDYTYGVNFPSYGGFINSGTIVFYAGPNNGSSTQGVLSNSTVSPNTWYHLAFVRNSTTLTLYINGVSSNSITIGTAMVDGGGPLYIGADNRPGTYFPGYMSNIRIVKGTALYTANFAPPSSPLIVSSNTSYSGPSNTALLLSGTNVGAYDSTMINDFVNIGGVSVNSNVKQYGTNSYYFNGSSYLYQANSVNLQSGTGDFTLESWIYPTNASGTQTVIEVGRAVNGTTPGFQIDIISGVFYAYYGSTIASSITGSSASNGTWYHVAVSRASGSLRFFINGTQVGSTGTDNTNYTQGYLWIGANPGGSSYFTGYLQDVRFTRYARYTSNFTVPSTPFIAQ
jgi:hypothetical protein